MDQEISRHRDHMDWSSPAVDPLEFPIPAILKSHRMKILARDHRTGEQHVVKALLRQERYTSSKCHSAYLLKRAISKSGGGGREETWAAIVLRPVANETSSSGEQSKSPFGAVWETTTKIVAIRVCLWKSFPQLERQRLAQVGQIQQEAPGFQG